MLYARWMLARELGAAAQIDRQSYLEPWAAEHMDALFCRPDYFWYACFLDDQLAGFLAARCHGPREARKFVVERLAVRPVCRGHGVGRRLLTHVCRLLSTGPERSHVVRVYLSERDDEAHRFLRAVGFRADKVLRRYGHADLYRFYRDAPLTAPARETV